MTVKTNFKFKSKACGSLSHFQKGDKHLIAEKYMEKEMQQQCYRSLLHWLLIYQILRLVFELLENKQI